MTVKVSIAVLLASAAGSIAAAPELSTFELDPRLKIELYAAEPDVIDPVALTFDASGRIYVVEMRDYPYGLEPGGKPGGTIRLLEDTDGDGKADRSTIFARDLSFPTSVAPWRDGVFVTAPPEIVYLKDTNGDRVADQREVYFTGFVLGVTDSNVNGLRWGLDNRIHGSNGGNGGTIRALRNRRDPVELRGADFSFEPWMSDIEATYPTSGGFGLVFDEFGRSFSTYNIDHIQQRIIPVRYLDRLPGMFPIEATDSISDHGEMARIFPISVAQTRPNHPEQAGYFSSAGGLGFIGYDAYPDDLYRSVVVGDVVGNLLHRDVLAANGPIFQALRAPNERAREFLASRDPACRLVGLELGPDGALYAIDMQRDVIEHPDYIPEKVRAKQNIRAGDQRGRIYRITPKDGLPKEERLDLSKAAAKELVAELSHRNQWRRQTAQRLLVERKERSVANQIAGLASSPRTDALTRVAGMWTLAGMNRLDYHTVGRALMADEPEVRENGLRLIERFNLRPGAPRIGFEHNLTRMVDDPSPRVAFQLALTLGELQNLESESHLARLLFKYRESYWIRMAVYCSLRNPFGALTNVVSEGQGSAADLQVARELSELAITRTDLPAGRLTEILHLADDAPVPLARAVLEGAESGFARRGAPPERSSFGPALARVAARHDDLFEPVWSLGRRLNLPESTPQREQLQKAIATVAATASRDEKLRALDTLRFGEYEAVSGALLSQLNARADSELQLAAVRVLASYREPALARELVRRWPELAPAVRPPALRLLLARRSFHEALITGIETGGLKVGELNLDLEQRRVLLRQSTPQIKARAAKFISDEEYSNRKAVVDEWLAKLPEAGDADQGRATFEKACAQCHRAGLLGYEVGPDLTSVAHRSVDDLLYNILDPSMAINPAYAAYQIETTDDEIITGILQRDSPDSINLLQAGAVKVTVPRTSIKTMRTTGTSLMPEGLETGLTPADLRDLIEFLQSGTK